MSQITLPAYGWSPRPDQMQAWAHVERNTPLIVLAAHRRWGKDELALQATATKAMQRTGAYLYCLPEYAQARKAMWEGVNHRTGRTRVDDAFPPEIIKRKDNQTMLLQLRNGSTVQFVGSDQYNSLVGAGPVGLVMSEAALGDPAAWAFFKPMLLESGGWSMHISTPRGKNHFKDLFDTASRNQKAYAQRISAQDTTVFTAEQLQSERQEYLQQHGSALGNALFEQEYMASFEAAIVGAVWGAEMAEQQHDGRVSDSIQYDPRFPVHTSWDLGVGDDTVVLFWQSVGNREHLIDYHAANDTGLDYYARVLSSKPYYYGTHYGPHDIQNREWGHGTSRIDQAKRLGLQFTRVPNTPKVDQLALGAQLMRRTVISTLPDLDTGTPACGYVREALSQYRFRYDPERRVMSAEPVHDWTSHYADAFMTYAVGKARYAGFNAPTTASSHHLASAHPSQNLRYADIIRQRNQRTGVWG